MKTRSLPAVRSAAAAWSSLPCAMAGFWILASAGSLKADPNTPLNPTITLATRPAGEVAVLTWHSVPGAVSKVQFQTALGPAAWQNYDVVTASGATTSVEVPLSVAGPGATASRLFFRVLPPQPTITGLEPTLISSGGGQLYLAGQCFAPGDMVRLRGTDQALNFLSSTLLLLSVPALPPGVYDVEIVRAGNVIASLTDALTITGGLALETLEPPSLPPGAPMANAKVTLWDHCFELPHRHQDRVAGGSGEVVASSVDLAIPGRGLDFIWATTYRSRNGEPTMMGNNWSHSYDIRCAQNGTDMDVRDGTGRHDTFFRQPDGSFSKPGFFRRGTLAGLTFTFEFADKGRWVFRPLDGSPAAGRIAQSIDRNGNTMQFNYDGAGRLAAIIDTLNRNYQVQYDPNGRIAAVIDFTGRMVRYTYSPAGDLLTITSPAVTGTTTGNDFPTGKTTTLTYSTGFADARLNSNLLTITDPKGQTSQRFAYSASNNPLDVNFDRVVSMQLGDQADPKDKPSVFTWLAQTPSPANSYAALKLIANDPVGNVSETFYDSRNQPVTRLDYTGRSTPGVAVTEAANLPSGKLRASDPDFFTTSATWNLNFLPTRITLPRGNGRAFVWESDFNATATAREAGNLRTLREIGTAGEALVWRVAHLAGFGTLERRCVVDSLEIYDYPGRYASASRLMEEEGIYYSLSGREAISQLFHYQMEIVPQLWMWSLRGKSVPPANAGSPAGQNLGIIHIPRIGQEVIVARVHLENVFVNSISSGGRPAPAPMARYEFEHAFVSSYNLRSAARGPIAAQLGVNIVDYIDHDDYMSCVQYRESDFNFASRRGGFLCSPLPYLEWDSIRCRSTSQPVGGDFNNDGQAEVICSLGDVNGDSIPDIITCSIASFPRAVTNPRGHTTAATYDAAGNCIRVQSPLAGTVDDFTYNGSGQITSHVHPANGSGSQRNDIFTYYNAGAQNGYLDNAVADAGGLSLSSHFEYDARGNVVRVVDPRGNDTLLTRNQLNEIVRVGLPAVQTPAGPVRYEHDIFYDANGNITRVGIQNRNEDGTLGTPTHFTTALSYDFRNRVLARIETVGSNETITVHGVYDGNRNLIQITLPEAANGNDSANIVRFAYDERRLLFRAIRAPGAAAQSTIQYDYGLNGRLSAHRQGIENAPRLTTYGYDGLDRLVRRTDALANVCEIAIDELSNVTRLTVTGNAQVAGPPVLLVAMDYSYNALNRLTLSRASFFDPVTGATFADGARTTTFARAANQQIINVTDDNSHVTSYTYNTANRLSRRTDARGNRTDFIYDANGNRTAVLLADKRDSGAPDESFRRVFAYDALDRLTSAQDNVGNTAVYAYDSRANLTRLTDGRGTDTLYTYDGLSRRIRSVEDMDLTGTETPADITRIYQYDENSRLTRVTDDNGNPTRYAYDSLNRRIGTERADGTQHTFGYDVHHNHINWLDANGTAIAFTYDLLNRLTQKTITPGGGVAATTTFEQFFYDGMSRVLRAVNDTATVNLRYDSLSNMRSESLGALITESTHDAVGNRLSLKYPSGRVLTYSYGSLNRVTAINDGALTLASHLYAGTDRLERADFGNGTRLTMTYDGQLGGPAVPGDFGWQQPVLVSHTKIAGGSVIDDRAMTWDRNQNKITRNRLTPFVPAGPTQTRLFDYDAGDRLRHSNVALSSGPMLDTQYQLDGEGNRLQVVGGLNPGPYTRNATTPVPADFQANHYTTTPFDMRQYDANGNVRQTGPTGPNGVARFMTFDYADRLVSAQLAGGLQVQYTYDAFGRRIQRDVQPPGPPIVVTTRFVYDGANVIEERDGANAVRASYAGPIDCGGDIGPVGGWRPSVSAAGPIDVVGDIGPVLWRTMRRDGQDYWLHADETGTVLALTNATGAVVERYDYDNFGEVQFLDAAGAPIPGATQSTAGNPYLFHAGRYDTETRFFNRAGAYFDPQTAVVVGPGGEEIFPDKYSRVKVRFPWDREGKSADGYFGPQAGRPVLARTYAEPDYPWLP